MRIYTIGFTGKTAERFFDLLAEHNVRRVIDVRLNNTGQLAAFTKLAALAFFLRRILNADYVEAPLLRPDDDLLKAYRGRGISWAEYEPRFLALMAERNVERALDPALFDVPAALLCSEPTADRCHRRLAVEYLARHWPGVTAHHL